MAATLSRCACNQARHQKEYGRAVAGKLVELWSKANPWKHEGSKLQAKVPGFQSKSWRLSVVPPSWSALEDFGLDDAVVGPEGDWTHAGDFVPLFAAGEDEGLIVAAVAAPHAVGWFNEASWDSKSKGYQNGVFLLADSLESFLAGLKAAPKSAQESHSLWDDVLDGSEDIDG